MIFVVSPPFVNGPDVQSWIENIGRQGIGRSGVCSWLIA